MGNKQPALTTDGRRHFSLFKQVDQLVGASEAEAELAFMHRLMALCSLPRTDPDDAKEFTRVNGPVALGMIAGLHNKLPYGNIPRLLFVWTCTEATQKQSRELFLGDSLSDVYASDWRERMSRLILTAPLPRLRSYWQPTTNPSEFFSKK